MLTLSTAGLHSRLGAQETVASDGIGSPEVFLGVVDSFRQRQLSSANPNSLEIGLGYVKGVARSFTGTAGSVAIDLRSGAVDIKLQNLTSGTSYGVWLMDRSDPSDANQGGDRAVLLAAVTAAGPQSNTSTQVDGAAVAGLSIDEVVVTRGTANASDVVASGSTSILQKIFFRSAAVTDGGVMVAAGARATAPPLPYGSLVPDIAMQITVAELASAPGDVQAFASSSAIEAAAAEYVPIDELIRQGSKLFNEETFRGNGRTCATCHPASNNFTIDVPFIKKLPRRDPLFVAEFVPALAQLERPRLMRQFGLILENVDGLEDPTNKFVMRSVPHTLGLPVSLTRDEERPESPAQMTGWSADGAPGAGSLRDFATGAVTQHFPKTLNRVPGQDFVLPTPRQLDAMEAFQLSLGRSTDYDLASIRFKDANVEEGKRVFIEGGGNPLGTETCNRCHSNGGAMEQRDTGLFNRNNSTNVELRPHPARLVEDYPIDGGFGREVNPDGGLGDGRFNVAPVVEAADTAPFFHNNVSLTVEDSIEFYTGPEFTDPDDPTSNFVFTPLQVKQLANFMRALNTLQNIDVSRRELVASLRSSRERSRLQTAAFDVRDAIRVLGEGQIYPSAVTKIKAAQTWIKRAQDARNDRDRRRYTEKAIEELDSARRVVATST